MASKAKPTGNGNGNGKQSRKPNILVIWGDDIGIWNISAYNQGMMGYLTPNIDRIAKEVAMMTDINLRSDPFEYGPKAGLYLKWYGERMFTFVPAQALVQKFAQSLLDSPPARPRAA
ncbi:hypothetical protein QEG98_36315 [Myxococcus sp. MxC21-1]|uniref:hypothetical protein n=1 Tax=Myxococcus sp. MxC21-1 TaxID=3041439 RepID=UPI0029303C33|nr:hypothetical protein [Myxococcus sp. MxC21-1]WNZ61298.1 hypothetical protein QEG98_36315 [Myxococcus sp. MxC21-1]